MASVNLSLVASSILGHMSSSSSPLGKAGRSCGCRVLYFPKRKDSLSLSRSHYLNLLVLKRFCTPNCLQPASTISNSRYSLQVWSECLRTNLCCLCWPIMPVISSKRTWRIRLHVRHICHHSSAYTNFRRALAYEARFVRPYLLCTQTWGGPFHSSSTIIMARTRSAPKRSRRTRPQAIMVSSHHVNLEVS